MTNKQNIAIAIERINIAKEQKNYYLNLSGLGLEEIPIDISDMNYLMEINLSYNFFSTIPEMICKMKDLQAINISHNCVSDIEFIFGFYYLLTSLDISNNYLYDIPDSLLFLTESCNIIFYNNPFHENLPFYNEGYDIWTIKSYLKLLEIPDSVEKLYETKLIFVGSGEVGKTTLIKALKESSFRVILGEEQATHGINIDQMHFDVFFPAKEPHFSHLSEIDNLYTEVYDNEVYNFEEDEIYEKNGLKVYRDEYQNIEELDIIDRLSFTNNEFFGSEYFISKNVVANLWDFGGQELYRATHQFFLTKRSIYIFVWEPRRDQHLTDFEYWLNTIKLLGESSPILIVMNKSDINHITLNNKQLVENFPNIIGFYEVSCLSREGIYNLKGAIVESLKTLPHLGSVLPKSWQRLRKDIKEIKKDFISYTEFKNICIQNGIYIDNIEIQLLSDHLHDIGDIIHFSRDGNLRNIVILYPQWATQAVYSLVDTKQIQKSYGLFIFSDLENYLDLQTYPLETHHQLLQLMEKFSICFKVVGEQDKYIIPDLLNDEIPDEEEVNEIEKNDGLKFKILFLFMPKGIINKLICKLYYLLTSNNYWKNGVVFNFEESSGLVLCDNLRKCIEIKIIGKSNRDLLSIIRNELNQIYIDLNLKLLIDFYEEIPCSCEYCKSNISHFFKYVLLVSCIERNIQTILCEKSYTYVNINELLELYRKRTVESKLIYQIITAVSQLQGISKSINSDENSRNTYIANHLSNKGIIAKDQSLYGSSGSGNRQGELDLKIEDNEGNILTIFEGVNLNSLSKRNLNSHILKTILNYDVNGLPEKYLGVYYTGNFFEKFCLRYLQYISSFNESQIIFTKVFDQTEEFTLNSEMRVFKSIYEKSGKSMSIIHVLINMK